MSQNYEVIQQRYQMETDAIYINFRMNSIFRNDPNFNLNWRVDEKVEYLIQKYNEVERKQKILEKENNELEQQIQEEKEICMKLTKQNEELKKKIQNKLDELLDFDRNEIQQALTRIKNQQNYIIQELKQQSLQQTEEKTRRVKELQDTVKSIRERNEQILSRQQGA